MLQLKDVVKDYPTATTTVHALRKVSLNFRESEFVAILGPSGCGKTTMLNIIGGLDRYTSGDLVIGGVSTADFDDEHWDAYRNATIGFVFQSYNLIPHLTVLENVELALSLVGEKKKARRAKAVAALHKVNMHEEIDKKPNQLSGGQMQRVAIARAIVNDPKIILADEPTGALDSELSVQVMDILQELSKNRLVIMVTHNAELAYQYATRICRFKDGQLIEDTNPYDPETEIEGQTAEAETVIEKIASEASDEKIVLEEVTTDNIERGESAQTSTLQPQNYNINTQTVQNDGEPDKKKKTSNHKRKVAMRNVGEESNAIFDKLGLNSLSKKKKKRDKAFKPTSMSAGMAFGLSLKNLVSKKRRTLLTSFAGAIGIIGLALVLSIYNGFNIYLAKMETEMLSGVPLGVYQYNVSSNAMMELMTSMMETQPNDSQTSYPDSDEIKVSSSSSYDGAMAKMMLSIVKSFMDGVTKNDITVEFADYMKAMPKEYYTAMNISYGLRYNLVRKTFDSDGNVAYKDVSQQPRPLTTTAIATTVLGENGLQAKYWQELAANEEITMRSYDFIGEGSRFPKNKNEVLLCVNSDNSVNVDLLSAFGIDTYKKDANGNVEKDESGKPVKMDTASIPYEYFIGQTFKLVDNDAYYVYDEETGKYENNVGIGKAKSDGSEGSGGFNPLSDSESKKLLWSYDDSSESQTLLKQMYDASGEEIKVVGVIRAKKNAEHAYVSSAICYTSDLAESTLESAQNSLLVQRQLALSAASNNKTPTVFDGVRLNDSVDFASSASASIAAITGIPALQYTYYMRAIGADRSPYYITVYPNDSDQKTNSGNYISAWQNSGKGNIGYFDMSEMLLVNMRGILDLVSAMLIAVAAISLVVSTVMIGVITSNSVVERTREIGILRAIGARKKDIRNVFIAETSLIGLASGLFGILVTYVLCPLISLVIKAVTGIGSLLHFHPLHALILVCLSLLLTVISGIIPAIMASRKNVVDALRVD
ncbi:MAG: ABC transporter ATP-binding protein/permease [Clostridia bacterium]|nr:ABC transporter ATP-binding protein/permease [Clostridia bacterium]